MTMAFAEKQKIKRRCHPFRVLFPGVLLILLCLPDPGFPGSSPPETAEWGFFRITEAGNPSKDLSHVTWSRVTALVWPKLEQPVGSGSTTGAFWTAT